MTAQIRGTDWNVDEVDLCVNSYFEHLAIDLKGGKFNKSQLYKMLSETSGRTPSSIEFKFQNISAVLDELSCEWIKGLAPAANYQELLAEKISRHINTIDALPILMPESSETGGLNDLAAFYLEPPPELQKSRRKMPEYMERLAQKIDRVTRDANNRSLGDAGEEFVFNMEKRFLNLVGQKNLAENVRWIAKEEGDGAGYDILSFTDRGDKKFVEVKTTVGNSRTPFFVSRNEYQFCKHNGDDYRLVRLFDFRKGVRGFELSGHLEKYVSLSTESYRAQFHEQ